ncbi:WD40-repeat-containing domain protein [Mycena floridula]|nr:WD40-repeat-containing domain protein [Mycena floridula]
MTMNCSVAYIAASTNRFPLAADISGSLIALGSSNLVALWDIADDRNHITETLPGHEGLVTAVRFVSEVSFVSGDDKGVLLYWCRKGSQWISTSLKAHEKPISCLCVYDDCLATGSSDSLVKIWKISESSVTEAQTLSLHGKYPLTIALSCLPGSKSLILAVAGTDKNITLWTRSEGDFIQSATLSGHEDWIRSLAFTVPKESTEPLVLASASQDATIRLWNIEIYTKRGNETEQNNVDDELLDAFEASIGDLVEGEEGGKQISLKRHILTVKSTGETSQQFSVTLDALLIGHEAGVTSLCWRTDTSTSQSSTLTLLSTSTDSSVILWSPSTIIDGSAEGTSTELWINRRRFGDVGGQRLGGFVGGLWMPSGKQVMAWGWSGGWRSWRCTVGNGDGQGDDTETWTEVGAISGHRGPVKDVSWSPNGDYLISVGVDQTTRIHGPIPAPNGPLWHELARPQVHGYDMMGIVFVDPVKFVSIADEKVARVFEASKGFVRLFESLGVSRFEESQTERPAGAVVPPLGLSNKASNEASSQDVLDHTRRPFEGELAAITLWPEVEKIFGHGYESISLSISPSRKLIATACKATTAEHAVVRVYDTDHWQPVGSPLEGHSLTVTRIAFSPDENHVLTVSRDRSWRLFRKDADGGYAPEAADKSHGRIIWDCAWAHEGDIFATASRDKTVRLWRHSTETGKWGLGSTIKLKEAATAVEFANADQEDRRLLAVGLESGSILIYSWSPTTDWTLSRTIEPKNAHAAHVQRLAWRPQREGSIGLSRDLASCSEDGIVKILTIS